MKKRIVTWNVNGIRSYILDGLPSCKFKKSGVAKEHIAEGSNLHQLIQEVDPDIICFQETRCSVENMKRIVLPDWKIYASHSEGETSRGPNRYSGVSIWTKSEPLYWTHRHPLLYDDDVIKPYAKEEGRFLMMEFADFYLINTYVPNAGSNYLYRTRVWDKAMKDLLNNLKSTGKHVIWAGDLNIARTPVDLDLGNVRHIPSVTRCLHTMQESTSQTEDAKARMDAFIASKERSLWGRLETTSQNAEACVMAGYPVALPGFTQIEREGLETILDDGYVDAWRYLHPEDRFTGYTWYNLRNPVSRPERRGWRIDYFILGESLVDHVIQCEPLPHIGEITKKDPGVHKYGSDHVPLWIEFNMPSISTTIPAV